MILHIKEDDWILKIELFLLCLLGISQFLSISYLNIIVTIIIGMLFLVSNLELNFVMIFTAFPFFNLYNMKLGTTSFYYIYIIIFLVKYCINKNFKLNKNKLLILFLLSLVRLPSGEFSLFFKWVLLLSVLIFTYNEKELYVNNYSIIKYMTISFIISSLIGILMMKNGSYAYIGSYIYSGAKNITMRFSGLIGDSVFFSQFCLIMIAVNLIYCYYNNNNNIFRYLGIILMSYFIILSYSKMGIIILVIMGIIYLLLLIIKNGKSKKNMIKSILILVISFIFLIVGIKYIFSHTNNVILKNYMIRFSTEDLSTGRLDVWNHYIYLIKDNWQTIFVAMKHQMYSTPFYPNRKFAFTINNSHNIYLETICCFGLITSIVIFLWVLRIIWKRVFIDKKIILSFPLLIILISGIALHGHFEWHYYGLVAISMMFTNKNIDNYIEN